MFPRTKDLGQTPHPPVVDQPAKMLRLGRLKVDLCIQTHIVAQMQVGSLVTQPLPALTNQRVCLVRARVRKGCSTPLYDAVNEDGVLGGDVVCPALAGLESKGAPVNKVPPKNDGSGILVHSVGLNHGLCVLVECTASKVLTSLGMGSPHLLQPRTPMSKEPLRGFSSAEEISVLPERLLSGVHPRPAPPVLDSREQGGLTVVLAGAHFKLPLVLLDKHKVFPEFETAREL